MKIKCATPVGLSRTVLAAAIAIVLSSPAYAADPEPTTRHAAAERATDVELTPADNSAPKTTRHAAAERAVDSEVTPADNSAQNARDVAGDDLTPLDQSHADADVETTRSIRKMLVDDDTLGTNAENVKVITVDGMVTLRGAVANADEQARIVAIAKKAAGPDRVRNELQVITR